MPHRSVRLTVDSMTREQRARSIVLGLVFLVLGCNGPPAAPSPPAEPESAEAVASLEFEPLTVEAGEFGYMTYWLSAPLPQAVGITTGVTPPPTYSDSYEDTVDFPAGQTVRRFSSGYSADTVGTWTVRIVEDRLPEGVVLGSPSSVTWTVVP